MWVERAFVAALDAITPGATAAHVDEAHRKVFREAGMEHYALKGLGHGIGLEIHEHPRVVIAGAHVLRAGMVFTVEPGLYIPGSHGSAHRGRCACGYGRGWKTFVLFPITFP